MVTNYVFADTTIKWNCFLNYNYKLYIIYKRGLRRHCYSAVVSFLYTWPWDDLLQTNQQNQWMELSEQKVDSNGQQIMFQCLIMY